MTVYFTMGGVLPGARNGIVREALAQGTEYIWWLDDDQPFDVGDLDKLLAHDLEAVIPLSAHRGSPFLPLLFDHFDPAGIGRQRYLQDQDQGLIRVAAAGMAGLLIKTACFERLGTDGWFEFTHPQGDFDNYAEDLPFYRRLSESGVQLYCDLDVRFGHALSSVVYILKQDGKWVTVLADSEPFVAFPQPKDPLLLGLNVSDIPRRPLQRVR